MPSLVHLSYSITQPGQVLEPQPRHVHALVSSLLDDPQTHNAEVKPWSLKLPFLENDGVRISFALLPDQRVLQGVAPTARLGSVQLRLDAVSVERQEFSSLLDLGQRPSDHVVLEFVSPTWFSRNGRHSPLPDPVLVFAGLARRWNAMAPTGQQFRDEQVKQLLAGVVISKLNIASVEFDLGKFRRTGFMGTVEFGVEPDSSRRLMHALSRFAEFSGVGAHTTHGAGIVIVGVEREPDSFWEEDE